MDPVEKNVFITELHGLSRFHVSDFPGMPFGNKWFYSIEHAFFHVLLIQTGYNDLAAELEQNVSLRFRPSNVYSWVIDKKKVTMPVDFIYGSIDVYASLIAHQLTIPGSNFNSAFEFLIDDVGGKNVDKLRFICIMQNDRVYGTGSNLESVRQSHTYPGNNLYGLMIEKLFREYTGSGLSPRWRIDQLFTSSSLFGHSPYKKMILVIGDSQLKLVSAVSNGDIVSISGAKYHHIVQALDTYQINLSDYRMIVVSVGVNLAGISESAQLADFSELRHRLVQEARKRDDKSVMISPGFYHPNTPLAVDNARLIRHNLANENISVFNWSQFGNPFVIRGRIQEKYFDPGDPYQFHLGHEGIRLMWSFWNQLMPDLKWVRFNLSPDSRALPKHRFEQSPVVTRRLDLDMEDAVIASKARKNSHRSRKRKHE